MKKSKQYYTKTYYFPERIHKALSEIFQYPLTILESPKYSRPDLYLSLYCSREQTAISAGGGACGVETGSR